MGPHLSLRLLPDKPARAQREIQEVEQTARRALAEVRQTIRGYRTEGLAAELSCAEQTLALAGVRLECTAAPPASPRPSRARSRSGCASLSPTSCAMHGRHAAGSPSPSSPAAFCSRSPTTAGAGSSTRAADYVACARGSRPSAVSSPSTRARVECGRKALAAVTDTRPDVRVTDIEMPEVTGLTLAAEVRARHPDTQAVILTTFARPGYLRRALETRANGYLLKDRAAHRARAADPLAHRRRPLGGRDPGRAGSLGGHRAQ